MWAQALSGHEPRAVRQRLMIVFTVVNHNVFLCNKTEAVTVVANRWPDPAAERRYHGLNLIRK